MAKNQNKMAWRLAVVDPHIAGDCPKKWRRKYRRGAFGMSLVWLLSMVSGGYTFWIIFGNLFMAIPFSIFWAVIILNVYRLVLITVGNPHIPHSPKYRFPFGSFLFRSMFVLVIGLFIIKPVELLIMENAIAPHLEEHKAAVMRAHEERLESFEQQKVREIFETGNLAMTRTEEGGFFMTRIELMHAHFPAIWLLTALLEWIFIWPFWARVNWRKKSEYEMMRGDIEKTIVKREYERFKEIYVAHMLALTGRDDIWEEEYHDMPFCNEPIVYEEIDLMRPGSIYAWARIHAQENSGD